jgi:RNA polymerase sigma-70 factor (ECF subfamily)
MARADDVLQETFLTVTAKADDFVTGTNFVAWACRIAQFKVLEECKRNQKLSYTLSPEVIEAVCSTSSGVFGPGLQSQSAAEFEESQRFALKECITELSPHTRRAIELRYVRAHKAQEIAEILGWSIDSVYVVLSRARDTLQKCINGKMGIEIDG